MFSVSPVSDNYSFRLPSLRDHGLCIHISVGRNSGHNETPSKYSTSVISAERGVCEQAGFAYQAHKLYKFKDFTVVKPFFQADTSGLCQGEANSWERA